MRQRTERRIRELMGDEEDSGSDSEETKRIVDQGLRTISMLEFLVYGLLWFLIVLCAAFFYALLRHEA
jgi:hypothetical protein